MISPIIIKEAIFWIGSISGIVLALYKIYEIFLMKPKLYLSTKPFRITGNKHMGYEIEANATVVNQGRKCNIKVFLEIKPKNATTSYNIDISGWKTIDRDSHLEINKVFKLPETPSLEFPLQMTFIIMGIKKEYHRELSWVREDGTGSGVVTSRSIY